MPLPAWPPQTATPAVSMPVHRTSEYLRIAGTIAPLVGIGAVAIGAATAVAVVPVGAAITLAGLYALMRDRKRKISVLEVMRKAEIDNLNSIPSESKEWFVLTASVAGQRIIAQADQILDEHRRQINAS